MKTLKHTGIVGLAITLTLNLLALLAFHRISAVFFSHYWWGCWAPSYLVWLTFSSIGSAKYRSRKAAKP